MLQGHFFIKQEGQIGYFVDSKIIGGICATDVPTVPEQKTWTEAIFDKNNLYRKYLTEICVRIFYYLPRYLK